MPSPSAASLPLALALAVATITSVAAQDPGGPPVDDFGPRGQGPGGPMQRDIEVLSRFDQDDNGRLDDGERKAARAWLVENRPRRRGPGGPDGRGFPGGFPGGREGEPDAGAAEERRGATVKPGDVTAYPDRPLFDPDVVRTFFLTFPQADWYEELSAFHGTDVDIPADVTVDGATYRDVGVHFRGNTSYQGVRGKKKAMHLDFDFAIEDQALHGHSATNLINNHDDPSLLREAVGAWVSNQHSHAPRANLVRVVVNGEDFGVYSNVEHFDKDFLGAHFGSKKGSRFKVPPDFSGNAALVDLGDDLAAYKRAYELKSKDDPEAWQRLRNLCGLLAQASDAQLVQQLPQQLDVDGALWFLAVDNALLDGDGYYSRGSDYALWLDPMGRFHVLPRDGNEVLGAGGGRGRRGPGGGPGGGAGGRPDAGPPGGGPPAGAPPDAGGRPGERPEGARGPGARGRRGGPGGMRMPTVDQTALAMADDPKRPLIRRLLGIPAWRERYLWNLHTLASTTLDPAVIGPRVAAWRDAIEPLARVDAHSLSGFAAFQRAAADDTGTAASAEGRTLLGTIAARRQRLLADAALQGPWPELGDAASVFVGAPGAPAALRVTARAVASVASMTLHVAEDALAPFTAVAMADDGQHGDGSAGDGVFAATSATLPAGAAVRWFVEATAASGRIACWPVSGGGRPLQLTAPGDRTDKPKASGKPRRPGAGR